MSVQRRRMQQVETLAHARTIEAVKGEVRVGLDRHDRLPAYRALTDAYLEFVKACDAVPSPSWASDPMV